MRWASMRLLFVVLLASAGLSEAVAQSSPQGRPAPSQPARVPAPTPPPPDALANQPLPTNPAARRPRPFVQCNQVARQRRLRGAERRHFVARCQLGYGRALFRRRLER